MPHAGPRLGDFAAQPTTDSTTSAALLNLKGRSGASPYQRLTGRERIAVELFLVPIWVNQRDRAGGIELADLVDR